MASKFLKVDWGELFPTKTEARTPDMKSVPTFGTGAVDAPPVDLSDLSPEAGMTRSSEKHDFYELLSYIGDPSTPELQIAAGRVTGGVHVPRVGVAELSDHALKENFDRSLRRAMCHPSDMDDTFISHFQLYQSELRPSRISSTPKDIGGCKLCRDPNSTVSAIITTGN